MTPRLTTAGRRRLGGVALAATSALIAATALSAAPAVSAPDPSCPTPVAASTLPDSAPVHGLTVTKGTTPAPFTGTFEGTLQDGIAPGVDLILADLHSTTIDKVGIWAGMSGSPVYDTHGALVGAVSYSLGTGPSTIAGITPATEMAKLLTSRPAAAKAARTRAALPRSLARSLVASGAATATEAAQGMRQLQIPVTLSGLSSTRLAQLAPRLHLGRGHVVSTTPGPVSDEKIPVTVGGNMAASLSHGTITAAELGTATMVCGTEVVGFGHPVNFSGPASMSLHGARTVLIQDDPTFSGFKVANLGAPVGTVDNDRLAGLHAVVGALPPSSSISAVATEGRRTFTGRTRVTQPDLMPDFGFLTLLAAQDRVLDRTGQGTAASAWTIDGRRGNGAHFRFARHDLYADQFDVSSAPANALAEDLFALQSVPNEAIKITQVHATSRLSDSYATWTIVRVRARVHGTWVRVTENRPVPLRAGRTATLQASLVSAQSGPRPVLIHVNVPARALHRSGTLDVLGGNPADGESTDASGSSFPALLRSLTAAPRHNEIRATVRFRTAPGAASRPRTGTTTLGRVVSGEVTASVTGVR